MYGLLSCRLTHCGSVWFIQILDCNIEAAGNKVIPVSISTCIKLPGGWIRLIRVDHQIFLHCAPTYLNCSTLGNKHSNFLPFHEPEIHNSTATNANEEGYCRWTLDAYWHTHVDRTRGRSGGRMIYTCLKWREGVMSFSNLSQSSIAGTSPVSGPVPNSGNRMSGNDVLWNDPPARPPRVPSFARSAEIMSKYGPRSTWLGKRAGRGLNGVWTFWNYVGDERQALLQNDVESNLNKQSIVTSPLVIWKKNHTRRTKTYHERSLMLEAKWRLIVQLITLITTWFLSFWMM